MVNHNKVSFVSRNFNETITNADGAVVNGITLVCKDFKIVNRLVYPSKPSRALDGTMILTAEYYYIPQAEFTIASMSATEYSIFVKIVNAPSFQVTCYDYELGKSITREMVLNEISRERLLGSGGKIETLLNVKLKMESVKSYRNYTELSGGNAAAL